MFNRNSPVNLYDPDGRATLPEILPEYTDDAWAHMTPSGGLGGGGIKYIINGNEVTKEEFSYHVTRYENGIGDQQVLIVSADGTILSGYYVYKATSWTRISTVDYSTLPDDGGDAMMGTTDGTNWVPKSWKLEWQNNKANLSGWDQMQQRIQRDPVYRKHQDAFRNIAIGMSVVTTAGVGAIAVSSGAAGLAISYAGEGVSSIFSILENQSQLIYQGIKQLIVRNSPEIYESIGVFTNIVGEVSYSPYTQLGVFIQRGGLLYDFYKEYWNYMLKQHK